MRAPLPLLLAGLCLLAPHVAGARRAPRVAEPPGIRERARALFELRERARNEGDVPLGPLAERLGAIADTLERAGLDSLASTARYRLAGVLGRLGRRPEMQAQLSRAVSDALAAHDEGAELEARSLLVDQSTSRQPEAAIAAAEALLPRFRARNDERGVTGLYDTQARAWGNLGRWQESLAAARRSYESAVRAGSARDQATALGKCSQALRFLGRYAEAAVAADSAIALGRRGSGGLPLARALLERASICRNQQKPDEGLRWLDEALAIDRKGGDRSHEASTRLFRTTLLVESGRFAEALEETDAIAQLPVASSDELRRIQLSGTRAAVLLALGRAAEAESTATAALERFDAFLATIESPEDRAAAAVHGLRTAAVVWQCRTERDGPAAGWRAVEAERATTLRSALAAPVEPDAEATLARLREMSAALVEYVEQPPGGGLVFLLADGRVSARHAGGISGDDLRAARSALASGDAAVARAPLERLSRQLLAPVVGGIGDDVRRLFVVLPGDLEGVPFEALPLPGGGTVGDRWAVTIVPSAGVLEALTRRRPGPGEVVAFADPASRGARPLPASREEARRVARRGRSLFGRDVTRERLAREAPHAAVLHLATHTVPDPDSPSRPALRLAGEGAALNANAVQALGCAADLVVLSGCSTARGTRYLGEAPYGLVRAFLAGGARSVVATLWDVDDAAAARFMAAFYDRLGEGLARDEALRRARAARLAAGDLEAWAFRLHGVGAEPVGALVSGGRSAGQPK